jgi:DNA-binding MarR family transcriptional regulator
MIGAQLAQQRRVPDFDALIRLGRSPGRRLRMCNLAAQMSRFTSGVTRLVDRLERRHLVGREPCPGDRRSSLAVLTDDGATRVAAMLPTLVDAMERCFTGLLNLAQLQATMAGLRAVREAVVPEPTRGQRVTRATRSPRPGDRPDLADQITIRPLAHT